VRSGGMILPDRRGIGMAKAARRRWRLEEFLAFDDGTDRRYELFDGEIVAMAPPARAHGTLVSRLARVIGNALRPPCEVIAEAGIIPPERTDTYYQADLAVTCTPGAPSAQFVAEPVLIVEVLSPSTATTDRDRKLPDYRRIASLQDILVVSSTEARIEHFRREADGWKVQDHAGGGTIILESVDVTLDLGELYAGVLAPAA
jgi:Uma2 family endonuclease